MNQLADRINSTSVYRTPDSSKPEIMLEAGIGSAFAVKLGKNRSNHGDHVKHVNLNPYRRIGRNVYTSIKEEVDMLDMACEWTD